MAASRTLSNGHANRLAGSHHPNSRPFYYRSRKLVPSDMLADLNRAKMVITSFRAFKRRETLGISKPGRALLPGHGPGWTSVESEGQMLQRAMPELMKPQVFRIQGRK